jgi:diadenosine tetraphosphate (Ap4A) HIT family hydrolase
MDYIHLENARTDEQREVMRQIEKDNVCPFCSENLNNYHKKEIFAEGKYWLLTENQWPYEGAKNHLLAISKEHVTSIIDLPSEAASELFDLFKKAIKDFDISGYTIALRSGTTKYASSVSHLHAHLIEPDVENPNHQGLKFPVSKPAKKFNN